jgi:hypothetical protein
MAMTAALVGCGLDAAGRAEPTASWGDDGSVDSPVMSGDGGGGDATVDPADARADVRDADVTGDGIGDVVSETTVCTPGATRCSGNGVQTCDATGQWSGVTQCTGQTCVNGACVGVCAPGETQTVMCGNCGMETDACGPDGNWVQGTCGSQGTCTPGAAQCGGAGGNQPQLCNTMCQWANNGPACMNGAACMRGQCVCGTGTCTGCCASNNACQPGTTNNECGAAGVPCVDCTVSSQHCTGSGFCN